MGKFIDLTGEKFYRLTVIEKDVEKTKQKKRTYWKCQCECGNMTSVSVSDLRTGHTKSCGCLQKEAARKVGQTYGAENARNMGKKYGAENGRANLIDLTGKRFGRLIVINREESRGYPVHWNCVCDCGNKIVVMGSHLSSGHTQSCGCLVREIASKIGKENAYRLREDLTDQRFGKLKVIAFDEEKSGKGKGSFFKCKCDCGTMTTVAADALKSGHTQSCGCLTSKGEYKIAQLLTSLGFSFEKEKTFINLKGKANNLRFDFYLPKYNTCIEYQGAQHFHLIEHFGGKSKFTSQKENDEKKRIYCKDNNINLIEIPYWELNDINEDYLLDRICRI